MDTVPAGDAEAVAYAVWATQIRYLGVGAMLVGGIWTLFSLRSGERSSVARVRPRTRTPVISWYLRLRDSGGRDPLWGLVRVECAEMDGDSAATSRANDVSRWVLAEALPLALPDGRWDKMTYGVRDCEEFLRAIQ